MYKNRVPQNVFILLPQQKKTRTKLRMSFERVQDTAKSNIEVKSENITLCISTTNDDDDKS